MSEQVALCLNAGSSSLKFALFRVDTEGEESLATGTVERLETAEARMRFSTQHGSSKHAVPNVAAHGALAAAFGCIADAGLPAPTVIGHRVVHGGIAHFAPCPIDPELVSSLRALVPLAPLHQPAAIAGIEAALAHAPRVLQVACFDTAFHAQMPERARRYALPARFFDQGIVRYGFHGLSYEYALSRLGDPPPARVIIAHLGNGASVCAVEEGRSIDTTMGLTPTGGIMMGTRAGDLDPGLLLYLQREQRLRADELEALLNHESGLLAVGGSSDLRVLETKPDDAHAALAIEMFAYHVRKTIGAYVAALGGLDCLVFTGGIGEHSAKVRALACKGLEVMGILLDEEKNQCAEGAIHALRSVSQVFVVESDEDRMIARHAAKLARSASSPALTKLCV